MNIPSILVGVAIIIGLIVAISAMNRGNGACGGNCSTCAMSEHCEKMGQPPKKEEKKEDK